MKILSIGAHPDDIEFGVGGLMIKEAKAGSKIKYVICSLGEAGSSGTPQGRKAEATRAARHARAEVEFADLGGDCNIQDSPKNRIMLAKIIRQFKPDAVLAPSQTQNQHPDHLAVSNMARAACRYARYGGLKELKKLPVHKVSALYFYPSSAEWDRKPDIIVDVSEAHSEWEKAMSEHKSQMKTKAYLHLVTAKASYTGSTVGVKYAIGLWTNDPVRVDHLSDLKLSSRNY